MTPKPPASFSATTTRQVAETAARAHGLEGRDAQLVRLGENALYVLPSERVVVRIARSMSALEDARKEMRVARWLQAEGFPAGRLDGDDPEPLVVDEHPVTFWRFIDSGPPDPGSADLGRLLRGLHDLAPSPTLQLPRFEPFTRVPRRLERAPAAADRSDVAFLEHLFAELQQEYAELNFPLRPGPVHGDAHVGNLLREQTTGDVIVIDFEAFAWGPPEWDLTVSAARHAGFDWMDRNAYEQFRNAYGFDVLEWDGFAVLRAIRELTMTTWLMQLVDDPAAAREFRRRVDDIRSSRFPRRWRAF